VPKNKNVLIDEVLHPAAVACVAKQTLIEVYLLNKAKRVCLYFAIKN